MAHPYNRATEAPRSAGYDYGPPTTQGDSEDDSGVPQDNSEAVVVEDQGESPLGPPPDADTITDPGGSPTDESQVQDPHVVTLEPDTATAGGDVEVTVHGSHFSEDSVVEVDQGEVSTVYVSGSELTATLVDPGLIGPVDVTVRNPSNEQESNTVQFTWTAANVRTKNIREDSKTESPPSKTAAAKQRK